MQTKNPLEEIREVIVRSRKVGYTDEFTKMGVSDEILIISDALDKYYEISREPKPEPAPGVYEIKPSPLIQKLNDDFTRTYHTSHLFERTHILLDTVKEPLQVIKMKLENGQETPFSTQLSSLIVSIALQKVVEEVNSCQKSQSDIYQRYPRQYDSGYAHADLFSLRNAQDVMTKLADFEMTKECKENYETNRMALSSIIDYKFTAIESEAHRVEKRNNSGCMILLFALSTSMAICSSVLLLIIAKYI